MTFALLVVADRRAFLCGGWSASKERCTARRQIISPRAQEETATSTHRFIRRLFLVPGLIRQRVHPEHGTRIRVAHDRSPLWVGEDLFARSVRVFEIRQIKVDDPFAVRTAAAGGGPRARSSRIACIVRVVAVAFDMHVFLGRVQRNDRDAVNGYERSHVGLVDIGERIVYAVASWEPVHDLRRKRDMTSARMSRSE